MAGRALNVVVLLLFTPAAAASIAASIAAAVVFATAVMVGPRLKRAAIGRGDGIFIFGGREAAPPPEQRRHRPQPVRAGVPGQG